MSVFKKHSTRKSSILKKSRSKSQDVEYTALDLSSLRRRRTIAYKRMCKALEVGVSAVDDHAQRDMFFSYHQEIKKIASNFEDAHFAILEILDDPETNDSEMQELFDEMYYKVISIYRNLTKGDSCASQPQPSSLSNVRLPKIQLPTFTGDIKRFPEYFDTFNSLIHNSTSLSDTERFHYLISSLSGDALTVVKTFPLSSEYYREAYDALTARYKCKRELAFTCWREILTMNFNFKDAHEFRKSLDLFEENLCILKSVNLPVNHWDFVLVYHILSKLDTNMRRDFEEKHSNTELPSYSQLKEFLHSKCEALLRDTHFTEQTKQNKTTQKISSQSAQSKRLPMSHTLIAADEDQNGVSSSIVATRPITCSFCNESHSISSCPEFLEKSIDERMKIATDRNWCFNCLKSSHQLRNCTSIFSCRTCKRKHHSLLHRQASNEPSAPVSTLVSRSQSNTTVLLATAIVQVKDASGRMQSFRALFDSGSQSNFITESAVERLNLKRTRSATTVSGLGEAAASILGDVSCSIGTNDNPLFELDLHVLSKICGDQPIANLNTSGWSHIETLPLADPGFDIPGPIDLLFAADVFAESLLDEHIKGSLDQPTAFKSVFGWLLFGKTRLAATTLLQASETNTELNSLVQRFWDLDSSPKARLLSPDESLCEQRFISDDSRDNSGRHIPRLAFKENSETTLLGSRDVALRRFHTIERRLSRDLTFYSQYTDFMSGYIETGHMSLVPSDELEGRYFIPHHSDLHPESATTRLRVIFDESANLKSRSLNDTQLIGSKLQPNIAGSLLRCREHNIGFMSDVSQLYRQILISLDHRDYQRICWRASPYEPRKEYRLNTITYGVASSPFLACRTLQWPAEDEGNSYLIANQIILSDVYVHDMVTGCDSLENAQIAKSQIISLFNRGGFQLRKWVSNDSKLLADLSPEDFLTGSVSLDDSEPTILKVLGLKWDPTSLDQTCTKRSILRELCAVVLLSDLYLFFRDTYLARISFDAVYFWSDSTITLSWLRSPSTRWATFVVNRISHIQDIPTECWHHISSGDNPADICSRGQFPSEILQNPLWWAGSSWLPEDLNTWPSQKGMISSEEEVIVNAEIRKAVALLTQRAQDTAAREATVIDDLLNRYSSLQKILNILTCVNRSINNSRNSRHTNRNNFLNNVERHNSLMQTVKHVQSQAFAEESSIIKAAKSHLHRIVGDQVLTFEELTTLFIQIEVVLSSRLLYSFSFDPNDLSVLSPGYFLTSKPLTAVPDEDLTNIDKNRLSRWQLVQAFHQNFWSRWKHEYLNSLTQRAKWTKDSKPLKIGSTVIIKDDNRAPLHWPLGRVTDLIPGVDGVTRIAVLKTAKSNQIQRPLVKLCPLPTED